jgi:hypothetical protein
MSKFRDLKADFKKALSSPDWKAMLPLLELEGSLKTLSPLLALLPHGGDLRWRAAVALGVNIAALASRDLPAGRTFMRRLLWHMNEESGNLGWGIPDSMAEALAHCPELADEFSHILFSYILSSGRDDNFVEHIPLLLSCYHAAGVLAAARPDLALPHLENFTRGLWHGDIQIQGQAVLALLRLVTAIRLYHPDRYDDLDKTLLAQTARKLEELCDRTESCEFFDGTKVLTESTGSLALKALKALPSTGQDL